MSRPSLYRELFDEDRRNTPVAADLRVIKRMGPNRYSWQSEIIHQWCVIGPTDTRGYRYCLQWVRGDKRGVMVRAGCRFKTLPSAWKHWHEKALSRGTTGSAEGELSLAIVEMLLATAKINWLPGVDRKTTLKPKPKRRKS